MHCILTTIKIKPSKNRGEKSQIAVCTRLVSSAEEEPRCA